MKRKRSVGGYFRPIAQDRLAFETANNLRSLFFHLFYVLGALSIIALIPAIFKGYKPLWNEIAQGKDPVGIAIIFFPFLLPFIGVLIPKVSVELDRLKGVIRYHRGMRRYEFHWGQVTYSHQWFPTKVGGATLFTLKADPPFPEALERWIEKKKRRPPPGQNYQFNLGSFDVKGPEHGQAIFAFLDAWMHSQESAESLHESIVRSRLGE